MKKILLIFTTLLMMTSQLKAQEEPKKEQEEPKLHFGLKAAPSLSWINTDTKEISGIGTKFGFGYGLMTEFKFSEQYYFVTGIDITYRGGNLKYADNVNDSTTVTVENNYTLQYIELPITMKLKTKEIGSLVFFVQFGLAPAYNIRSKADKTTTTQVGSNPVTTEEEDDLDIKDDINNFNLSMIINAGIEYKLNGSTNLLTSLNFNNGFLDVFDSDQIKANTNFLALAVGILF